MSDYPYPMVERLRELADLMLDTRNNVTDPHLVIQGIRVKRMARGGRLRVQDTVNTFTVMLNDPRLFVYQFAYDTMEQNYDPISIGSEDTLDTAITEFQKVLALELLARSGDATEKPGSFVTRCPSGFRRAPSLTSLKSPD
jgi:hypothetical protein